MFWVHILYVLSVYNPSPLALPEPKPGVVGSFDAQRVFTTQMLIASV
jgi:hypothetical protein